MRNPTTDPAVALDGAPFKDKRALVLFLFGIVLLAVDLWPKPAMKAGRFGEKPAIVVSAGASGKGRSQLVTLDPACPIGPAVPARYALFLHQPLAINRADRASLELLPGVGPHLADAIVAAIAEQGPMSGPQDLQKVAGIGPKTLERLLPLIYFGTDRKN